MVELLFVGVVVGALSGFFGIGGGTVLVPMLLFMGFDTKVAIGISVIQMVFGSIFGSYLNKKKGTLDTSMVLYIGAGGFVGGLVSGFLNSLFSNRTLEFIFFAFAIFALIRLFMKTKEHAKPRDVSQFVLFLIGIPLGALSMVIGVGGSILLVPLLVGFLHVPLNKAISAGLFFVMFSSISGLISHYLHGVLDIQSGVIIGLASLFGVYLGIHLKDRVTSKLQKNLLVGFYLLIVIYLAQRVFF